MISDFHCLPTLISSRCWSANLGYVYENMVAQMLTAGGNKLFYHTQKYLLYTKDLQKDGNTLLLPLYMAPFI